MSELRPHLTADEEVGLRRVALGFGRGVAPDQIRRLRDHRLIEADKTSWRLTPLGQQRFEALPRVARLASDGPDAIAMTLLAELREGTKADRVTVEATDAPQAK
jgi:hypothetical protein